MCDSITGLVRNYYRYDNYLGGLSDGDATLMLLGMVTH